MTSVSNPYEWEPRPMTNVNEHAVTVLRRVCNAYDTPEVENLRIALADALGAPHTLTVEELVDWSLELRNQFERSASRRYRVELLATGYAMGQVHGFAQPRVPLSSLSPFVDAVLAEDVDVAGFQALYERMARGETTKTDLPNAA